MKKITLLFLASLAVLATGASAAATQNESDVVVLPTYTVTTARTVPAEDYINASLKEFVQQASVPMVIAPELPLRKAQAARGTFVKAVRTVPAVRLAKS